ncbi:MAG: 4Fe-4S binding protein [Candidatus Latescibacterota bacterium]
MVKPKAVIQYTKCAPEKCNPDKGVCCAGEACTRNIFQQEEKFESPILFPLEMCQGCGACIAACPLEAVMLG